MLLRNLPLLLRSRSRAVKDTEGARLDDAGWPNEPVPVPVPLLVVLLTLLSRECVRMERRRATLKGSRPSQIEHFDNLDRTGILVARALLQVLRFLTDAPLKGGR